MNQENQHSAYTRTELQRNLSSYSGRLIGLTLQRVQREAEFKKKSDRLPKLSDDRAPTRVYTAKDFNRVPEPQYTGGLERQLEPVSLGVEE